MTVAAHLEHFKVILWFFYQVFDGEVHSLSVPGKKEKSSFIVSR